MAVEPTRVLHPLDARRYPDDPLMPAFCDDLSQCLTAHRRDVARLKEALDASLFREADLERPLRTRPLGMSLAAAFLRLRAPDLAAQVLQFARAHGYCHEHLWASLVGAYDDYLRATAHYIGQCIRARCDDASLLRALFHLTAYAVHRRVFADVRAQIREDLRARSPYALSPSGSSLELDSE